MTATLEYIQNPNDVTMSPSLTTLIGCFARQVW